MTTPSMINCVQCGASFARRARGPVPRYCSAPCRARSCDERAQNDGRYGQWGAASKARRAKPRVGLTCPFCEAPFEAARAERKHCGEPACRAKWHAKRMQQYVHARRAAKAGSDADRFDPAEIFERDAWLCWICGGQTQASASRYDPSRATLDHVVPLSKGGAHSRSNVRCAHLRCNLKKGDRLLAQAPPVPPR